MTLNMDGLDQLTRDAVALYWSTLDQQGEKQRGGGAADYGSRAKVTGGKQMDGFSRVVRALLESNGLQGSHILHNSKLELPGYFRPTKNWDMLVIHDGTLLAALEFKSQSGSFGNNFNNRTEEALGTASDLWTAYREGAFGKSHIRPWLGWLMLLEDSEKSNSPVRVAEPYFSVFPEFHGTSYAKRYELLIQKMILEKFYDGGVLLMATAANGPNGIFSEPAIDLTMRRFLAGLGGHVTSYLAMR